MFLRAAIRSEAVDLVRIGRMQSHPPGLAGFLRVWKVKVQPVFQ